MTKHVTMQMIADALNTTKNTVSQALSGKPGVSEDTRRKILECADRMGYQYQHKQAVVQRGYIGLIAAELVIQHSGFFTEIYLGIERELKARGFQLLMHTIQENHTEPHELPAFITNADVDAVIVLSQIDNSYLRKLENSGIPCLLVDHHYPGCRMDCVLTNNRYGAYEAVEHLISLGHSEIGFIGAVHQSPSYMERYEGYLGCLRDHNLTADDIFALSQHGHTEAEFTAFLDGLTVYPTAWFCANDMSAFLLVQNLSKRGIVVPDEISICGFDDIPLAAMCHPSLTTMRIDRAYFCERVVERLFWRLERKGNPAEEILLPAELIIRHSSRITKRA
jgi:LacI family transcriptional regulator